MKGLSMRISAGMIALGGLFYFLACSPAPQSNNSSQNQNVVLNQNQSNARTSSKDLKACDDYGSGHGAHASAIKKEIEAKMGTSLKKLLKDPSNPGGTFTVEVQQASNAKYYVAYIKGKVSGDDNLKELSDILNDFQNQQECLRVIYFLPESTTGIPGDGFEWAACEHPMVVCPNGECCMPAETNTNTNSNSNANTNTNANGNRGGNTNN